MDDYVTIQELPSGIGYADLLFLPRKHSNKPAILIELKWDKSVKGAIGQIKKRSHATSYTAILAIFALLPQKS